jgi:hypothetical protein
VDYRLSGNRLASSWFACEASFENLRLQVRKGRLDKSMIVSTRKDSFCYQRGALLRLAREEMRHRPVARMAAGVQAQDASSKNSYMLLPQIIFGLAVLSLNDVCSRVGSGYLDSGSGCRSTIGRSHEVAVIATTGVNFCFSFGVE